MVQKREIIYENGKPAIAIHLYNCTESKKYFLYLSTATERSPIDCENGVGDISENGQFSRLISNALSHMSALNGGSEKHDFSDSTTVLGRQTMDFFHSCENVIKDKSKKKSKDVASEQKKSTDDNSVAQADNDDQNGLIAPNLVKIMGAEYGNFNGVQSDDPIKYTQTYARLSVPFGRSDGIRQDAKLAEGRLQLFRNALLQVTFNSANKLQPFTDSVTNVHYSNKLDLLQYSYFNAIGNLNIVALIIPSKKRKGDYAHIYLDAIAGLTGTTVSDSNSSSSHTVYSNLYGFNSRVLFTNLNTNGKPIGIEGGFQFFWLVPSNNIVRTNQNFQIAQIDAATESQNPRKPLQAPYNMPFYRFNALIKFNTSKDDENSTNFFLNFSYIRNFAGSGGPFYVNQYMQFQIGVAIDIIKTFSGKNEDKPKEDA